MMKQIEAKPALEESTRAALRTPVYPKGTRKRSWRTALWEVLKAQRGFLFVLPALALFLVIGFYTVVYSFLLSFFRWDGFGGFSLLPPSCTYPCQFVGLDNFRQFLYEDAAQAHVFWQAAGNTAVMAIAVTCGTLVVALPLALALNRALRGMPIFRTAIVLPMVTAGAAIYYVWSFIYNPDGLLNGILKVIGLGALQDPNGWLGDPAHALPALIVVLIWDSVPLGTLLYLTGLQTLDKAVVESAVIDGANALQRLRNIIWPLLRPITVIIIILTLNAVLQSSYEMVYLMTGGGPADHTNVLALVVFTYGFGGDSQQLGMASAVSWVLFFVVFLVALANLKIFSSRE